VNRRKDDGFTIMRSMTGAALLFGHRRKMDRERLDRDKSQKRAVLSDLTLGESAVIDEIALPPETQQFLMRFGLFPGVEVKLSRRAPFGDPSSYWIDGAEIALRAETTRQIFVIPSVPSSDRGPRDAGA
jgi:Fe2+ transport system protein FeoA